MRQGRDGPRADLAPLPLQGRFRESITHGLVDNQCFGAFAPEAHAKTIIPLRVAAIVANLLAMAYSHMHGTYPTFVLNALLLPLRAYHPEKPR